MSDPKHIRVYANGKKVRILSVDTTNGLVRIAPGYEAGQLVICYEVPRKPIRITWIRPRYGLRRMKRSD